MSEFEELKIIIARILVEYEERTSEIIGCELEDHEDNCYAYNGEKFGRPYKRYQKEE